MGLQRDDDIVLRTEFGGIVGAVQMLDALLAVDEELEAVLLHRFEMGAARDQAHFGPGTRKLHAHIAADGSCTVDADFHYSLLVRHIVSRTSLRAGGALCFSGSACIGTPRALGQHVQLLPRMQTQPSPIS